MEFHPDPLTKPIPCGESLEGVTTPENQLAKLFDAGLQYRSFKYWDRIRVDRSEQDITGSGFNCVKFDPRKPARTIRRNDETSGCMGRCAGISAGGSLFRSSSGSVLFRMNSFSRANSRTGSNRSETASRLFS